MTCLSASFSSISTYVRVHVMTGLIVLAVFGLFVSVGSAVVCQVCATWCRKPGVPWIVAIIGLNILSCRDLYSDVGQAWCKRYEQFLWIAGVSGGVAVIAVAMSWLTGTLGR